MTKKKYAVISAIVFAVLLIGVNILCMHLNQRPLKPLTNIAIVLIIGFNIYNSYKRNA